jgi:hypothetical protein
LATLELLHRERPAETCEMRFEVLLETALIESVRSLDCNGFARETRLTLRCHNALPCPLRKVEHV